MRQRERLEKIAAYLRRENRLDVEAATKLFAASPATIRRDFATLTAEGRAERERGGVRAMASNSGWMSPFAYRETRLAEEKARVAARAAELVLPGDVIFIDGGTTTFHLAASLPDFTLRVITNSTRLAMFLDEKRASPNLEVYLTGGFLYPKSYLLTGPGAADGLRQYHADWAFLSASGVRAGGVYNNNERAAELERVMIDHCDRAVVLADHEKIGRQAMCRVCGLEKIHALITDDTPEIGGVLREIEQSGVKVMVVSQR